MTELEYQQEIGRLRGIINRNAEAYKTLQAAAKKLRIERDEARLAARRQPSTTPDWFEKGVADMFKKP